MWVPVYGFEARYEVSSEGIVRNRKTGRVLTSGSPVNGYPRVTLYDGIAPRPIKTHKIVANSFLGPCPEGKEVRHADGDRANPRLDNLSYATKTENHADKVRHGTHNKGSRHNLAKLTEFLVVDIRRRYATGETPTEIAADVGVTRSNISSIVHRKTWTHVGDV